MGLTWMRTAAISCLVAGGAMIAGPGAAGAATASADLFGIDILDILGDDDDEKKSEHPATRVDAQQNVSRREEREFGIPAIGAPPADLAESAGGGGGGAAPRSGGAGRPSTLPAVPTAPSGRTIVIRAEPPVPAAAAPAAPAPLVAPPVVPLPVVPPVPVIVPPVLPIAATEAQPSVQPPAEIRPPRSNRQPGHADSFSSPAMPTSFRAGYADRLREATLLGLVAAALPGVAGILAFTTAGGVVGYRQARAAQALPPANIANVARFLQ